MGWIRFSSRVGMGLVAMAIGACGAPDGPPPAASSPDIAVESPVPDPPASPGAMAPRPTVAGDEILLTWLEPSNAGHRLRWSRLRDGSWGGARTLAEGDAFFANWADVPGIAEGGDGSLVAHWLEKLGDETYAYGVRIVASTDDGETWVDRGLLHDDDSPTEHGFVAYAQIPDGLQAFWLDGRAMAADGPMELRSAAVVGGIPGPSRPLDDRTCECCQVDAVATAAGPLAAYRDRTEGEIRDVALVRRSGGSWSEPSILHPDGWEIPGCPVNGPAVAAEGDRVAVAWFTGAGGEARVLVAHSSDGGRSFGEPALVDGDEPLGRVDVVLDPEGTAVVSWLGTVEDGAELRVRRVDPSGTSSVATVVARTTGRRSAGVPRLVRLGDAAVAFWVEDTEPSRLRARRLPFHEL